jgi:hypothetical protein
MYLNPKAASCSRLPFPAWPSTVRAGCGTTTSINMPMASTKVAMSISRMPFSPMNGRSAPASSGATTPGPACTKDIIPFARPYCSFGTMVLIAAEYAGHWNALPRPMMILIT